MVARLQQKQGKLIISIAPKVTDTKYELEMNSVAKF